MTNARTENWSTTEHFATFHLLVPEIVCAKIDGKPSAQLKMAIMTDAAAIRLEEQDKLLLSYFLSSRVVTEKEADALLNLSQNFRSCPSAETATVREYIIIKCAQILALLEPTPSTTISRVKAATLQGVAMLLGVTDYPALNERMRILLDRQVPIVSKQTAREKLAVLISGKINSGKNDSWTYGELGDLLPVKGLTLQLQQGVRLNQQRFLKLLAGSISLSKEEKIKMLEAVGQLEEKRLRELVKIFKEEKAQYQALGPRHTDMLERLENKVGLEWLEIIIERQKMKRPSSAPKT